MPTREYQRIAEAVTRERCCEGMEAEQFIGLRSGAIGLNATANAVA